jgi:uncharacterized protein YgiM (DUF1202 family)
MKPFPPPTFSVRLLAAWIGLLLTPPALSAAEAGAELVVQAPVANFYTQPSPLAPIIDVLTRGDRLTVVQRDGKWYVGRLPDDRLGWVHQDIFREAAAAEDAAPPPAESPRTASPPETAPWPERVRVASRSAQVRKSPSDHADIAFALRRGDTVRVLERTDDWYRVADDADRTGWAFVPLFAAVEAGTAPAPPPSASAESPAEPAPPPPKTDPAMDAADAARMAVVEVRSGRVRAAPSLEADIRTGVSRGEVVAVTDTAGDWYAIATESGETGWAHRKLFGPETRGMLRDIRMESAGADAERVTFELNGFHPPDTFALEEDGLLKIVCDFEGVLPIESLERVLPMEGKLIQRVRLGVHETPDLKVRAVVDLSPEREYGVEQVFYRETSRYVLTIQPLAADATAGNRP